MPMSNKTLYVIMKQFFVSNQLALLLLCLNQHMRNKRNSFFSVKQNCSNSCRVPLIPIETTILSNDFYISTGDLFLFPRHLQYILTEFK